MRGTLDREAAVELVNKDYYVMPVDRSAVFWGDFGGFHGKSSKILTSGLATMYQRG